MGADAVASPEQVAIWEAEPLPPPESFSDKFNAVRNYFKGGAQTWFWGTYSYAFLCMPTFLPWKKGGSKPPPFYGVNESLPVTIALIMGLQHALAMVGGLVVPPLLIGAMANNTDTQRQMINSAMICSGLFTFIHVVQFPIYKNWVYGSGILSCTGISFTFLTPTQSAITLLMEDGKNTFDEAYGKCLGTLMVTSLAVIAMSFLPTRVLRRIFPPMVPGLVIFLIGVHLIESAFANWGGGAYCQEHAEGIIPTTTIPCITADTNGQYSNTTCYPKAIVPTCSGNGNVKLPFGSPEYIGLGFCCFVILVVLEIFGSPVMRNAQIIIALLLGYLIAGVTKSHGNSYVVTTAIKNAPGGTFLWVGKTFPIGIYGPLVLPYLVGMIVLGVEVIGDVTATAEVSKIETSGPKHRRRIQGGLLADGFNCLLAACAMTLPVTTFAQNNGVINITQCASRMAGIFCGGWLILLGIIAPVGAFFTSIPNCVLGGVTAFLFANVAVSGIKIITLGGFGRRNRFIISMSAALGLGVNLVENWATNALWPVTPGMSDGVRGFRDACIIVLESGYSIGFLSAVLLHLIIPMDEEPSLIMSDVKKGFYDPTVPRHEQDSMNGHGLEKFDDSAHPTKMVPLQDPMKRDIEMP